MEGKWTVYYDGYCNLCSSAVQWIVRNDRAGRFRLLPLQQPAGPDGGVMTQGETGIDQVSAQAWSRRVKDEGESRQAGEPDTVVLIRDGKLHTRSTAMLLIASRLRFPWPLLTSLIIIPRFLRDPVYNLIARNRKSWFGERTTCYLPPDTPNTPGK
jgi:predicted DCC family thiol-disulfide oxidoreductase YuxK